MAVIDDIRAKFKGAGFSPHIAAKLSEAFELLLAADAVHDSAISDLENGVGFTGDIVLKNEQTYGIKLDPEAPVYGWRDILGSIEVRGVGANNPTFATYTGTSLCAFQFSASTMNEVFIVFHVPHDYVPGTDIYIHAHWSNAAAAPNTGDVAWAFDWSYAKGYNQQAFTAPVTASVLQNCPATRYQHNIAETDAITISGLETDGLILVRVYRDAASGKDTCTDAVFLHTADVHYQSTNVATKNRNFDFWT